MVKFLSKRNSLFFILLVIIISVVLSDTDDEEYPVNGNISSCEETIAESEESCKVHSDNETRCCYANFQYNGEDKKICVKVLTNLTFILNYLNSVNISINNNSTLYNNVRVNFSCGQTENTCGTASPKKIFECREHSSYNKSCCYIEELNSGKTNCLLNSFKSNGEEVNQTLFGNNLIYCSANSIKVSFIFLIILFMIF